MKLLHQNPFRTHIDAIRTLADAGIRPPAEWQTLADRWDDFTTISGHTASTKLTDAIVNGGKADIDTLYALSLAETLATAPARAEIRNRIEAATLRKLRAIYQPHAIPNFNKAADIFDSAANRLTAASKLADAEADADTIVNADDTVRAAWSDALIAARQIDAALLVLVAAAGLAGLTINSPESMIALTVNTGTVKRRQVWAAYESTGRCGRWSALLAAGCTIQANRDIDNFEMYLRPLPMETKHIATGRGSYRRVVVDPEEPGTDVNTPKPPIAATVLH